MQAERRFFPPVTVRSRLVLEVASELASMGDWPHKQVRLTMRDQVVDAWGPTFFASDSPDAISEVARGEVQLAIVNPGAVLTLASRGTGPFKEPVPLCAITVIHSFDQLAFAVSESSGISSLEEIRDRRIPLRVSLRGQQDHSIHLVTKEVLSTVGFSIEDIVSWGGQLSYHPGVQDILGRVDEVERGRLDAIFDEGVNAWANRALEVGMRFLPLEEGVLSKLEAIGFERGTMSKQLYPRLPSDVLTLDYSGFIVYTHADTSDELVRAICIALEARRDRIPRDSGEGPLPLEQMCRDTIAGPLKIPLHPAAERFWREKGYLH